MKKLDWKAIGQFMSVLVKLITNIVESFRRQSVGTEILDWLADDGKADVSRVCTMLVHAYREKFVVRGTIDLGVTPLPPYWRGKNPQYVDANIVSHITGGKVTIEKRPTGLYLDGKKVIFSASRRALEHKTRGGNYPLIDDLFQEVSQKQSLSCTVLDYLVRYPEFLPDELVSRWDNEHKNGDGYSHIFFLATTYRTESHGLTIRYLSRDHDTGKICHGMMTGRGVAAGEEFLAATLEEQVVDFEI